MAIITVRDFKVDVDIERELSRYSWHRAKWRPEKLIACSPFRYDASPSFYVYIEDSPPWKAGTWGDSGGEGEYRRGDFVKLLAFLRNETELETEYYLLSEYASEYESEDDLELDFSRWYLETKPKPLDPSILDRYNYRHPYLERRGVSDLIQRRMRIGYDPDRNAISIPWFHPDGRLANIKYRRVDSKIFFYESDGEPIRNLLYGIDLVYDRNLKRVALVEAEIDALYLMSEAKIGAIACGTNRLTKAKVDLIARSPIEELIVFPDNDRAGQELRKQAVEMLSPYVDLKIVNYPTMYKDPNEIRDSEKLRQYIKEAEPVIPTLFMA